MKQIDETDLYKIIVIKIKKLVISEKLMLHIMKCRYYVEKKIQNS